MPPLPDADIAADDDKPNLGHLWVFVHVAETGSISQTAEILFRAQSVITRSIQKLESAIGNALFERRPSGMLLTPVGNCVLARTRRVFFELETLARWCATQGARALPKGSVPTYLLNTRRLDLLAALAKTHHMPAAAKSIGVTQSAVSAAIKVLEVGSGIRLFQRNGRGIVPTPQGQVMVLHVRRALNELRLIPDDISALRGNLRGEVIVGIMPLARTVILPRAIARVAAKFPGIRICTNESPYEMLNAELRAGDVDFIVTAMPGGQELPGLISELLMYDRMLIVARKGHPLARRRNLTLAELHSAQWIFPRIYAPVRAIVDDLFVRENLAPPIPVVESSDSAVLRGTLNNTDMIAAISGQQLHLDVVSGELAVIDVRMSDTMRAIGLRRRAGHPSPAAQVMMDILRDIASESVSPAGKTR
ncbi:MAG TPA: LysR family transcriptional regulator [Herbaspirillum sp.]|jgi:LysR family transcriptional regulator of gallate degradation